MSPFRYLTHISQPTVTRFNMILLFRMQEMLFHLHCKFYHLREIHGNTFPPKCVNSFLDTPNFFCFFPLNDHRREIQCPRPAFVSPQFVAMSQSVIDQQRLMAFPMSGLTCPDSFPPRYYIVQKFEYKSPQLNLNTCEWLSACAAASDWPFVGGQQHATEDYDRFQLNHHSHFQHGGDSYKKPPTDRSSQKHFSFRPWFIVWLERIKSLSFTMRTT